MDGLSEWQKYIIIIASYIVLLLVASYLSIFRYVVLVFDEMEIREDLVFDKSTGEVTEFIEYGEGSLDQ